MSNPGETMKKYILLTGDIHPMGGMQNYARSKAEYLEQRGWKVYILFYGYKGRGCAFSKLEKYVDGGIGSIYMLPDQIFGSVLYKFVIAQMLQIIEYKKEENCEYLIESSWDCAAVWGEFLAKFIGGKHICFIETEGFRGSTHHYVEYLDFFAWKYHRGELAGVADTSLAMLFEGHMEVEISPRFKLTAAFYDNVSDVHCEIVEELPLKEWNITYFGRCEKGYFPYIVNGVREFAQKHTSHTILFVIVGSMNERERNYLKGLEEAANITVRCIGYFSELPRKVFEISDVMLAGAGCALIAARQGVPTIVPDAGTYKASGGILGYTTDDFWYGKKQYSYSELLEDVLIHKEYKKNIKSEIPRMDTDKEYEAFFEFARRSSQKKEYFEFCLDEKKNMAEDDTLLVPLLRDFFDKMKYSSEDRNMFVQWFLNQFKENVALFGIGTWGKQIVEIFPELSFDVIYDNNKQYFKDIRIEKPLPENMKETDIVIISLLQKREEVLEQLIQQKYTGEIRMFIDIVLEYLEVYVSNFFVE